MPARAETPGCMSGVGKKVPVLFVHGLAAKGADWDPFRSYLSGQNLNIVTDVFDYSNYNTKWVTDPNIGAALADKIACLATSSRQQGGQGKVIVVAHSMGGLATRQAIAERSAILQDLGMVITIATPNTGSDIAGNVGDSFVNLCKIAADRLNSFRHSAICQTVLDSAATAAGYSAYTALMSGSAEIKVLADWPKTLPVHAIAGSIRPHFKLPYVGLPNFDLRFFEFDGAPSGTDTLVTVPSALHSVNVAGQGKTDPYECTGNTPVVIYKFTKADCKHGDLIKSQTVQQKVANVISGYISSATVKPSASKSAAAVPCLTAAQAEAQINEGLSNRAKLRGNDPYPVVKVNRVKCIDEIWAVSYDKDGVSGVHKFDNSYDSANTKEWHWIDYTIGGGDNYCAAKAPQEVLDMVHYRCSPDSYPYYKNGGR